MTDDVRRHEAAKRRRCAFQQERTLFLRLFYQGLILSFPLMEKEEEKKKEEKRVPFRFLTFYKNYQVIKLSGEEALASSPDNFSRDSHEIRIISKSFTL